MNSTKNQFLKFKHIKSNLIYGKENITRTPLISIVIPTYNRPLLLKEAIESALNQKDFSNYEVIVVDNNPDSTIEEEIIKSFNSSKLFYYKNEINLGMTGNFNRCIELAKGRWVTILHDDDLLYPNFLREMNEIIRNNDNVDLLTCIAESGDQPHSKKNILKKIYVEIKERFGIEKITLYRLLRSNINPFPGVLFKKDLALNLGGFDEIFYPAEDYAFWFKYCLKNQGFILYKTLSFYRKSGVNESQKMDTKLGIIEKTYQIQQIVMNNMHLNKLVKKMFNFIILSCALYSYRLRARTFEEREKLKEVEKKIKINKLYKIKFLCRILRRFFIVVTKFYFICTGKNKIQTEEIYKNFNNLSATNNV